MLGRPIRSAASIVRGISRTATASASLSTSSSSSSSRKNFNVASGSLFMPDRAFLIQNGLKTEEPRRCYAAEADLPPHHKVKLPALSPTMEHGTIVSWEKKEGDQVCEGDLLCEIETDKATMGFETPEEGYLAKILLHGGSKDVPIGKLLCIIVSNLEDVAKFKNFKADDVEPAAESPMQQAAQAVNEDLAAAVSASSQALHPQKPIMAVPSPSSVVGASVRATVSGDRPFASPAAKQLAAERGIDLSRITSGSGMDGMITSRDIENFVGGAAATPMTGVAPPIQSFMAATAPGLAGVPSGSYSDADLTNMRKTIAKRLQASKQTVPHYYLTVDCVMDNILKLRADLNAQNEKEGIKLSVNDFIIKATALASKRVPQCNSAWMDTFIREHHSCDVSVAVDTGSGLITPIVQAAERKGLAEISANIKEMAGRAKDGKLLPHEFMGGTITVSNLGMFGISHFTAIINNPQSCILAVGGTTKKVVPSGKPDSPYKTVNMMTVTLSCDHRVVDGAVGASWLKHFKSFMENPSSMLL